VPALNEEHNLPPLTDRLLAVEKALGHSCEILIVDDASDDNTYAVGCELAQHHGQVRVVHRDLPRGLGNAVRTGLAAARGYLGVVVMADGVDPLESALPEFCTKIMNEGCDLVLLSRYLEPGDADTIPFSYKFLHWGFRWLTRYALGIRFRDATYAFRAFKVDFLRSLGLRSKKFEISPEITFRTIFAGGKVGEVRGRQTRRVRGKSKFQFSKAFWGYTRVLLEACWLRWQVKKPAEARSDTP
jgi:dolichol-phosphate mannosyltransferase